MGSSGERCPEVAMDEDGTRNKRHRNIKTDGESKAKDMTLDKGFEPERGLWIRQANKKDLLSILDNVPCGIVVNKRPFGKVLYINRSTLNLSGYTIQDIPNGRVAADMIVGPGEKRIFRAAKKAALKTGYLEKVTSRIRCKNGEIKICEIEGVTLQNGITVSMWTDVTRRERAEARLKERESLFGTLFEESPDAILLLQEERLIDCNRAALMLLCHEDKGTLTGVTLDGLAPKKQDDGRLSARIIREAIAVAHRKKGCRIELTLKRSTGEEFPTEVTVMAITLQGKELFFVIVREITAWKQAERALLKIKDKLEDRVRERTSRLEAVNRQLREEIRTRKSVEKELKKSREELRHLSEHIQRTREEERTRIAREVHDELGQTLSALKIDLTCFGQTFVRDGADGSLHEQMKTMEQQIDGAIQSVREICSELRPPILDHFGLPAAVEWYLKDFERRTGVRCQALLGADDLSLDKRLAFVLFRILQEAMTNILRHSGATTVMVQLGKTGSDLVLTVSDNGKGITRKDINNPRSFGLIGIRERVRFWGGASKYTGIPKKGTTLTISVPFNGRDNPRGREGVPGGVDG